MFVLHVADVCTREIVHELVLWMTCSKIQCLIYRQQIQRLFLSFKHKRQPLNVIQGERCDNFCFKISRKKESIWYKAFYG